MREELERFVASLAIPPDRKLVVQAELIDHVECAMAAARRDGQDPERAAREAIGNLDGLRRSLEAIEPAFRVSRLHTALRGVIASLLVALLLDQGGAVMAGAWGVIAALAIALACAPARALDMLRGELRAPRVRGVLGRGSRIGPVLTYIYIVMCLPIVAWIALIVIRAFGGVTRVDVPISAFAIIVAGYVLLAVEGFRARRVAVA